MSELFAAFSAVTLDEVYAFVISVTAISLIVLMFLYMLAGLAYGIGIVCLAFLDAWGDDHDYEERVRERERHTR